jgi:hypothetical protein
MWTLVLVACSGILTQGCRRASCRCCPSVFFAGNAEQPGVQPELVESQEAADSGVTVATQKTKQVRNRRPYAVIGLAGRRARLTLPLLSWLTC